MATRYRCPSCYTEFENAEDNPKCERCSIDAFPIGQVIEAKVKNKKPTNDVEPPANTVDDNK